MPKTEYEKMKMQILRLKECEKTDNALVLDIAQGIKDILAGEIEEI